MNAKELRIGNYVYAQSGKLVINRDSIYKIENINLQSAKKYEPIPLTEEWLLKFGFNKNNNTFILNKYSSVTHEKTGFESGFWYSNDESNAHCYRLKKIEFVHELQNLHFALTGEELEFTPIPQT